MQIHLRHIHIWKYLEIIVENAEPLNMQKPIAAYYYMFCYYCYELLSILQKIL